MKMIDDNNYDDDGLHFLDEKTGLEIPGAHTFESQAPWKLQSIINRSLLNQWTHGSPPKAKSQTSQQSVLPQLGPGAFTGVHANPRTDEDA